MWMKLVSPEGAIGGLFNRVKLIPDPDTPKELPLAQKAVEAERSQLSFRQTLPWAPEERARSQG